MQLKHIRAFIGALLILGLLTPDAVFPSTIDQTKPKRSPAGQVAIAAINANQFPVLGLRRFRSLFELAKALRQRPEAFDSGFRGAVHAPDIVMVTEIRPSNLEILAHILRQRFKEPYELIGPVDSAAAFIINTATISSVGEVTPVSDACATSNPRYRSRTYPLGRFVETATGANFAVVGVHFPKSPGDPECLTRNVQQMRVLFEADRTPTILAGDFNRRPVTQPYECDPNEKSEPLGWWEVLTAPSNGGRQFIDSVRSFSREHKLGVVREWTHEQQAKKVACTGNVHHRRSRIDYIFVADAIVAEAHADHPGWAGDLPGERHPTNYKYSDHRWVWTRLVLSGPPKPDRPEAVPNKEGVIHLTWSPVEGATQWVVYRAIGSRRHHYRTLARLTAENTSFDDGETEHGQIYRYAIAPVGADGGQGLESAPAFAQADAVGPQVVRVTPARGATGVGPGIAIEARFDENVVADSVQPDSMKLFLNGRRVRGIVRRKFPRLLKFNPNGPLKKGKLYTAVVAYGLRDQVGNPSRRFAWSFRTVEPPPRKKRGKRG